MVSAFSPIPREVRLGDGSTLLIREPELNEAQAMIEYIDTIGEESDFLTFGRGEHGFTETGGREFISSCKAKDNCLYIVGEVGSDIVTSLSFVGGSRPRIQHVGEFGLSVRKRWWGRGIGSLMLDSLIAWGRANPTVTKINLRVRTDNVRAVRLYERKGFLHEGTIRKEMWIDGQYFDQHVMGLDVELRSDRP